MSTEMQISNAFAFHRTKTNIFVLNTYSPRCEKEEKKTGAILPVVLNSTMALDVQSLLCFCVIPFFTSIFVSLLLRENIILVPHLRRCHSIVCPSPGNALWLCEALPFLLIYNIIIFMSDSRRRNNAIALHFADWIVIRSRAIARAISGKWAGSSLQLLQRYFGGRRCDGGGGGPVVALNKNTTSTANDK